MPNSLMSLAKAKPPSSRLAFVLPGIRKSDPAAEDDASTAAYRCSRIVSPRDGRMGC